MFATRPRRTVAGLLAWAVTLLLALGTAYAGTSARSGQRVREAAHSDDRPVVTPVAVRSGEEPGRTGVPDVGDRPDPGLHRFSVVDPVDHTSHDVYVWRPDVPDSATLPVLYYLHGTPSSARTIVYDENLPGLVANWIHESGIPFVLVVPDGNGTHHTDTEWANAFDGSDMIEDRILDEVIPAVEGRYRRDAAHRAIAGFSMGGYGAMNLALRHPDYFGSVVSLSGYFHIDDPSHMFGDDPLTLRANRPDQNLTAAHLLRIFLAADKDENDPVIQGEAQRFKRLLDLAGIPATLDVAPGGHDWDYVRTVLPGAFAFLAAAWHP